MGRCNQAPGPATPRLAPSLPARIGDHRIRWEPGVGPEHHRLSTDEPPSDWQHSRKFTLKLQTIAVWMRTLPETNKTGNSSNSSNSSKFDEFDEIEI